MNKTEKVSTIKRQKTNSKHGNRLIKDIIPYPDLSVTKLAGCAGERLREERGASSKIIRMVSQRR